MNDDLPLPNEGSKSRNKLKHGPIKQIRKKRNLGRSNKSEKNVLRKKTANRIYPSESVAVTRADLKKKE
jgi:hypothetical protein